jgi:hypothetical protein
MTYDWKPTSSRTATPTGGPAVQPPHEQPEATVESVPFEDARLADVVEDFVADAEAGRVKNRNGRRYKPSALRDVSGALRLHVVAELGEVRLRDVQWQDLQQLIDQLAAEQLSLSRIRSVVSAIRALYGYAIERGIVDVNTADGLEIPKEAPPWTEDTYDDTYGDEPWSEDDEPATLRERAGGWRDAAQEAWTESSFAQQRRGQHGAERRPPPVRRPVDTRPMGLLPERVLSLVLRLILVVFILIALASLAQAVLVPA